MRDATDSRFLVGARAKVMPQLQSFDKSSSLARALPLLPAGKTDGAALRTRCAILISPAYSGALCLPAQWLRKSQAKAL